MIKRTLSGFAFLAFAVFALWVVGISSGVIERVIKTPATTPDVIARAIHSQTPPANLRTTVATTAVRAAQVATSTTPAEFSTADISATTTPTIPAEIDPAFKVQALAAFSKMPLVFIQNAGQVESKFKFYEQGSTHATYFAPDGVYIVLSKDGTGQAVSDGAPPFAAKPRVTEIVKLTPVNAKQNPEIVAEAKQPGVVNYYIGNDPKAWKEGLATYQSVRYSEIYPGVDMRYYGDNSQLVYDVIVKPGADPRQVQFEYEGIQNMQVGANGDLEITLAQGSIIQKKPFIYQEVNGQRVAVDGRFDVRAERSGKYTYGFQFASYDTSRELVIDPTIVYSTYHGGTGTDVAYGVAVDATGIAYYTGSTTGSFPTTTGPAFAGGALDAFVTRRLATGAISWTTYYGGSGSDVGRAIALSITTANPLVYIVGNTNSPSLPQGTDTSPRTTPAGGDDGFISSFDTATGVLGKIAGSFVGGTGSDYSTGLVVTGNDPNTNIYVTGYTNSATFPLYTGSGGPPARVGQAIKGFGYDAYMAEVWATGAAMVYGYVTYLGGSGDDYSYAIALGTNLANQGAAGWAKVAITGSTTSPNFPSSVSALDPTPIGASGVQDAFIAKFYTLGSGVASSVEFSTYMGTTGSDVGRGIAIDTASNVYVTGETFSGGGTVDAFVTKYNPDASIQPFWTTLGGSGSDVGYAIALDAKNSIYVAGATTSADFIPIVQATQATYGGNTDAFLTRYGLMADGVSYGVLYSTYLGGSGVDAAYSLAVNTIGVTSSVAQTSVYVVGSTVSTNFPTVSASQTTISGVSPTSDSFFTKFNNALPVLGYSSETGYGSGDGVRSDDFFTVNNGSATTKFTYKVVYTHADNVSPSLNPASSVTVCIDSGASAFCPAANSYTMQVDVYEAASALRDTNYANGEQYAYTITNLAAGAHNYFFEANDGTTTIRLPLGTTSLAAPAVSSMVITTSALADARKNVAYSAALAATGPAGTYSWTTIPALPASLVISGTTLTNGTISGTPQIQNNQTLDTTTQPYAVLVKLTDSASSVYTKEMTLAVLPPFDTVAPSAPVALSATPGAGQVTLNWTTPYDYYGVTQYQIWRYPSGVPASAISVGTTTVKPGIDLATTFTNTGLTPSTNYTFEVRARDAAANWSASAVVSTTTLTLATMPLGEAADSSLNFTTLGDALWYVQSVYYAAGGFGLNTAPQSGSITDSQRTSMSTTMTGPGTLTFQWKVSSELDFDLLSFYLDGVELAAAPAISGEVGWTLMSVAIPVGAHTVTWTYAKDSGTSAGTDAAWIDQVSFVPVETSKIAAGLYHTVTINADGSLWAWGDNTYGQLGVGTSCNTTSLVSYCKNPIQIGTGYKAVAAGAYHTLGIKTDGTLWAWGRNNNGQLGDGTLVNKSRPTKIGAATGWTDVEAGYFHSVAMSGVAGSAVAYTWGDNTYGQLGIQTGTISRAGVTTFATASAVSPTLVSGGFTNYKAIAAGAYHNAAVLADGTLRTWGGNSSGQLGDGTTTPKGVPTQIGTSTAWRSVAAGDFHTVADRVNNTVFTWGANNQGQLGDGTTLDKLAPSTLALSGAYKAIGAGTYHTIAIDTDGKVWTWGANTFGQLGDATSTSKSSPVQAGAAAGLTATAAEAGYGHTLVIKTDGTLWVWGDNSYGQLGNGLVGGVLYNAPSSVTTAGNADQQAPSVPTGLAAVVSSVRTSITLSWASSVDNVAVTTYKLYRDSSQIMNNNVLTYVDTVPVSASSVAYSYNVLACDVVGNCSTQSPTVVGVVDASLPSVPTSLTARAQSQSQIYLSWPTSTDNIGVTGYEIFQTTPVITASMVGTSTTTDLTITGLTASTTYGHKVRARDAAGNRSALNTTASTATTLSAADVTAPSVPGGVTAVASAATTITLSWTASTDAASSPTGIRAYSIYRNDGAIAISSVSAVSYTDTGRRLDSTYKYTVQACDWAGNCASSSQVSATTTASGSFAVSAVLDNATLTFIRSGSASWYGVSGVAATASAVNSNAAQSGELGDSASTTTSISSTLTVSGISGPGTLSYRMKVSSEPAHDFLTFRLDGAAVPGMPDTSGEVDWATRSVTFYTGGAHSAAWAYTKDSSGSAASDAAWVDQVTFVSSVLDTQAPSAPAAASAVAISSSQIDLTWNVPYDNTAVTAYQIFQASPVVATSMVGSTVTNSFSHTGLTANTAYQYQVRAGDAAGNWSALSVSSVSVMTRSLDSTAPSLLGGVTGGLVASVASPTQINLSWTAASDAVGVTKYELSRYTTASGVSASAVVALLGGAPPATSFVNNVGLEPSTGYVYLFRAGDAAGNWSTPSSGVAASTPAAATTNVDLVMSALSASPTGNVTPGASLTFVDTVKNQGAGAMTASRSYVFFYLSADSAITATDTLIGYRLVNTALNAASSSSATTTAQLPATLSNGATYYLGAIADALNQQVESDEINNATRPASAIPITIITPAVDLVMTAVGATPTTVVPGGSLTLDGTIKNQGTAAMTVSSTTVGYYLSADSAITTADTLLGSQQVNAAIASGVSSTLPSMTISMPAAVGSGSYFLGAIADSLGQQPENNETNNSTSGASAIPITVSSQGADLKSTAVSGVPSSIVVGGSFTVTDTVANSGTAATTASRTYVGFYLSPSSAVVVSSSIPSADTRIGFRLVNGTLAAGASSVGTTVVTIPTAMASGVYYIRAMADVLKQQGEFDETNNILTNTSPITITIPDVDLTVSAVSTVTTTAARGSSFTVSDTEAKTGTSAMLASTHYVFYYLSTDKTITTAETRIAYRAISPALGTGSRSSSGTVTATVPTTLAAGTYYFGAIADALNQQPETLEDNNAFPLSASAIQFTVTP